MPFDLQSFLAALPTKPGIYRMLDKDGGILYVGKARHLRNRVTSYFHGRVHADKTTAMLAQVASVEVTVTASETEALLLEHNLIKQHRPRYNILLKDDKSFPYIKVDVKNEWPTISITRRRYNDGAKYIGRVPSAWSARHTYDFIRKVFPLRSCNKQISGSETRPCLKYHIRRCPGPCISGYEIGRAHV